MNRGAEFDDLYVFPPLLDACCRVIGRPFKLSSLHARTVRAGVPAQALHVDVRRDSADWPLVGFTAIPRTRRGGRGGRSRVRLFRGQAMRGPTSRPACNRKHTRDSARSRDVCLHSNQTTRNAGERNSFVLRPVFTGRARAPAAGTRKRGSHQAPSPRRR